MPGFIGLPDQLGQGHAMTLWFVVSQQPSCDEQFHEATLRLRAGRRGPSRPTGFVVLAVRIVVAVLRSPHLISRQNHGRTQREIVTVKKFLPADFVTSQLLDRPWVPLRRSSSCGLWSPLRFSSLFAALSFWLVGD